MVPAEFEAFVCKQLFRPGVVQRRPLEVEEQELGLDLGRALLRALEQRTAGWIGGICREQQPGVGGGSSQHVLDLGQLQHGPLELR